MGLVVTRTPAVCTLRLDSPPGNIIDRILCLELSKAIRKHGRDPGLKAFVIAASGANFSYGASVQEHVRGSVEHFLPAFHDVFEALMETNLPAVAAVRGRCLGGAFELAGFCHFLIAGRNAVFAVPEIQLGVFPPLACAAFPWLLGGARADKLILGGLEMTAAEALAGGLATVVCEEEGLEDEAQRFLEEFVLPRSAAALRQATRALREPLNREVRRRLPELEHHYLNELMATHDAQEGIDAFLEKRPPAWTNE